jgi:uncharacterized protein YlxW (UPF0749 family)
MAEIFSLTKEQKISNLKVALEQKEEKANKLQTEIEAIKKKISKLSETKNA